MVNNATEKDYPEIIEVWELSVRATHHFLPEGYLQHIKTLLPSILPSVQLFITRNENGKITGFLGVAESKIEMLFIHPADRGKGTGRLLTQFAIDQLQATAVDVNEQNEQAVGFYVKMGFSVIDRTNTDGLGKPYPLLLMKLIDTAATS
ncbi:MAG: GNAT family N-acetyltransferase [Chitinophagaceae bacterium]